MTRGGDVIALFSNPNPNPNSDWRRHRSCIVPPREGGPEIDFENWRCEDCVLCRGCSAKSPIGQGDRSDKYWRNVSHSSKLALWTYSYSLCEPCGDFADKKQSFCGTCKQLEEDDVRQATSMIKCGRCASWVHAECTTYPDDVYQQMCIIQPSLGSFFCPACQEANFSEAASAVVDELFKKDVLNVCRDSSKRLVMTKSNLTLCLIM